MRWVNKPRKMHCSTLLMSLAVLTFAKQCPNQRYRTIGCQDQLSDQDCVFDCNNIPVFCRTGMLGKPGMTGEAGNPGYSGFTGPEGPMGPIGFAGEEGPQGPEGSKGADNFVVGPIGEQGPKGPMGPWGPVGETGDQGDVGIQGVDGFRGPAGPQGALVDTFIEDHAQHYFLIRDNADQFIQPNTMIPVNVWSPHTSSFEETPYGYRILTSGLYHVSFITGSMNHTTVALSINGTAIPDQIYSVGEPGSQIRGMAILRLEYLDRLGLRHMNATDTMYFIVPENPADSGLTINAASLLIERLDTSSL